MEAIVVDSKLTFRIQELPEGKSERRITLSGDELELEALDVKHADVDVRFYKTTHFIKIDFDVSALVTLTCDRSLDEFDYNATGTYSVIFEPDPESVSEDASVRIKAINSSDLTLTIEQEVRDTIMLGLPAKKIHPRFLDSEGRPLEFETRTFGKRESDEPVTDPRWETLKKLKN